MAAAYKDIYKQMQAKQEKAQFQAGQNLNTQVQNTANRLAYSQPLNLNAQVQNTANRLAYSQPLNRAAGMPRQATFDFEGLGVPKPGNQNTANRAADANPITPGTPPSAAAAQAQPFESQWSDRLSALMDEAQNRDPFRFDLQGNGLYQQYRDMYTTMGQQAMRDTMGQAAGLTGGYGSSYGQIAGQSAYNNYLQQLNDKVPELYAQERAAYDADTDNLFRRISMAGDAYNREYGEWRDRVADERYANEMDYNRAYQQWRDSENDRRYYDERDYDRSIADRNWQYQLGRDQIADNRWDTQWQHQLDREGIDDERYINERDYNRGWNENERDYNRERDRIADERYIDERDYNRRWNEDDRNYRRAWDENERDYNRGRDSEMDRRYYDEREYGRERDQINDERYINERDYNRERDRIADERYIDERDYNRGWNENERDYNRERDRIADERYINERDYNRERDRIGDERYINERDYNRGRDQIEDERWNTQWEYNRGQASRDDAHSLAMAAIQTGTMPDAATLQAAGIPSATAQAMANWYRNQYGGSGSGGSRRSSGSGGSRRSSGSGGSRRSSSSGSSGGSGSSGSSQTNPKPQPPGGSIPTADDLDQETLEGLAARLSDAMVAAQMEGRQPNWNARSADSAAILDEFDRLSGQQMQNGNVTRNRSANYDKNLQWIWAHARDLFNTINAGR